MDVNDDNFLDDCMTLDDPLCPDCGSQKIVNHTEIDKDIHKIITRYTCTECGTFIS